MKRSTFFSLVLALFGALLFPPQALSQFGVNLTPMAAPAAAAVTRYQETDSSIVYSAGWQPESTMGWSGGSAMYTATMGAQATFTFTGTGVDWIGYRGRFGGIVFVYLDGNLVAVLDTYSPTEQVSVVVYSASGLAAGSHSLTVYLTGAGNPLAAFPETAIDAFDVTR